MSKPSFNQLARYFLSYKSKEWVWVKGWGCFLTKEKAEDLSYKIVAQEDFLRLIWEFIEIEHPDLKITKSMVVDVACQCEWASESIDEPDKRYFAFLDAIYDTETFSFVDPDGLIVVTSVPFTREEFENQETPQFNEFLRTTFVLKGTTETDETIIYVLQEMMGNIFLPTMEAASAFFFTGSGSNGKSVLLDIIVSLVGKDHCSFLSMEALTTNRFAASSLVGKCLNVCAEEESKHVKSDKFKALVSGDTTMAERKYGRSFPLRPLAKFVFATNDSPSLDGVNHGVLRRVKIIPFFRRFGPEDRIPRLAQKMLPERAGVLRWAMEGAKRLVANNYYFSIENSEAIAEELRNFQDDTSSTARFMRELQYIHDDEAFVGVDGLYADYRDWCFKGGFKPMNKNNFSKDISAIYSNAPSYQKKVGGVNIRVRNLRRKTEEIEI